jgi:ribosomal protein S18 acetylase RimI-like enzyme
MIKNASPENAPEIARLIVIAMGSLANKFTNNPAATIPLFEHFARLKGNQYSYENTLVWEQGGVRGMISGYNGADLKTLREPFLAHIQSVYDNSVQPEDETQAGEYYIDCLAVFRDNQGKGIGKKLILGLADHAGTKGHQKLGLLVNKNNPAAKKLYTGLGFQVAEEIFFMGDLYDHLQLNLT